MANSTVTVSRNKPVQLARCGCFYDPRYGDFQITHAQLDRMIENFQRRVTGTDIFIDVSHRPENGAAGKITRIWRDDDVLMANVEWTPYGLTSMEEKGYCYLSMDYDEDYRDNETKIAYGCVLKGAGLTIRPFIKRLEKVQLDEFAQFKTALAKTGIPPQLQTALAGNYLTLAELLPSDARQGIGEGIIRCAELLDFPTPPVAGIAATFAQFKTALAKTGIPPQSQTALAGNYLALAELLPSDALQGIGEGIIRCAELLDFPTPPIAGIPATPAPPATLLSERQVKEIIDRWFEKQEQEQEKQLGVAP